MREFLHSRDQLGLLSGDTWKIGQRKPLIVTLLKLERILPSWSLLVKLWLDDLNEDRFNFIEKLFALPFHVRRATSIVT